MNRRISRQERESARYGRPVSEIAADIFNADEQICLIEGSDYADRMFFYEAILEEARADQGLLEFLNDAALRTMSAEERRFLSNSRYCKLERAREFLMTKRLSSEAFDNIPLRTAG